MAGNQSRINAITAARVDERKTDCLGSPDTHTPSTQIYSATVLAPDPRFLSFAVLGVFEHLQPLDVVL